MSLIPPPPEDQVMKLNPEMGVPGLGGAASDAPGETTSEEPAAMTLAAIGKGGDGGPLGLEGFGDDDNAGGSDLTKITQHSAFAIVLVAVIAVAVLGLMRLTQGRMGSTTDPEIEAAIDNEIMAISTRNGPDAASGSEDDIAEAKKIIGNFTRNDSPQVPIEYVQKNPFELAIKKPEQTQVATTGPRTDPSKRIKDNIRREVGKLQIDMIMAGTDEKAVVINGELYKVGDTVSIFRVESIEAQKVNLRHDKYRVPLKVAG